MERNVEKSPLTSVSIVEAMDYLQQTKEGLATSEGWEESAEVYSYDSLVYGRAEIEILLWELRSGSPNEQTGLVMDSPLARVVQKLARSNSVRFNSLYPRFFEQNITGDASRNTVPHRLEPIAMLVDEEYLMGQGLDELLQLSDILEDDQEQLGFNDRELLFTEEDFEKFLPEIIALLSPQEVLNLFKRLHKLHGDMSDAKIEKQLFEILQEAGVLSARFTNPHAKRDWFLDHRAGSRQLLQVARTWATKLDYYREKIAQDIKSSDAFIRIEVSTEGVLHNMYVQADRPTARYALDHPESELCIVGPGQIYFDKDTSLQSKSPKPGKRYLIEADRIITSAKGVALSPHTPDALESIITRPGARIAIKGNTLLTALAILKDQPHIMQGTGLSALEFSERLFALAASPRLRQRIFERGAAI